MKTILSLLGALALAVFVPRASAAAEITFQTFYDGLSPYGDWVEIDDYGYCWQPWVDSGWAPYTDGEWANTDSGWTWVSNEDFGWATYHYGRWMQVNGRGWVWVPGYEWGPGWVSWRNNNDYVGWAPLPPRAAWRPAVGIGVSVDLNFGIGPSWYNFCPVRYFGNRGLRPYIVPRYNNVNIINNSVNVTNISVVNNNIYNGGPDYNQINRYAERQIPRYRLNRGNNIDLRNPRYNRGRIEGDTLNVVAPRVNPDRGPFRPTKVAGQVPRDQIRSNGWDDVKPAEARQIRENIRNQAREDRQQQRNDTLANGNNNNLPPNATTPGRGRPGADPANPSTVTGNEGRGNRFGDRGNNDQPLASNTGGTDRQSRRDQIIRDMEARRQGKTPPRASENASRNETNPRGDVANPNRRNNGDANSLPAQARRDQPSTEDQSTRAARREQVIRDMEARRQGKSTPKTSETSNRPSRQPQQDNAQANTPPAPSRQNRPDEQTARNAKRDDIIRQMEARRTQQGQSSTPKRSQPSRDEAAPQRSSRNDEAAAAAQRSRQREAQQESAARAQRQSEAAQRQNNSQRESFQRQAQQQNERRQAAAQQQDNARRQAQQQQRQQAERSNQMQRQQAQPQRQQVQQQRQPQRQAPQQSRSERQSSREEKKSKKDDN